MQNVLQGSVFHLPLDDRTVQCVVTSPPYWGLRDYGIEEQMGKETSPEEYIDNLVRAFKEVRRVLRDDGTVWLNLGDTYSSGGRGSYDKTLISKTSGLTNRASAGRRYTPEWLKPKDLIGIPWMAAFALRDDGWYLRQDIIWSKPNPMPESVEDRCTKSHEYIFLLTKNEKYYYNAAAIKEPTVSRDKLVRRRLEVKSNNVPGRAQMQGLTGNDYETRNRRSVWTITSKPYRGAHFATFPTSLVEPCLLAGSRPGDLVLDPFAGAGTVGVVAKQHHRKFIGIELNPEYCVLANERINKENQQQQLDESGVSGLPPMQPVSDGE